MRLLPLPLTMLMLAASAVTPGCGRIGFDAGGTSGPPYTDAAEQPGPTISCAEAAELAIGAEIAGDLVAATDHFPPLSLCPSGADVVFRVTVDVSTTVSIVVQPRFDGAISTSRTCPPTLAGRASCNTFSADQLYERSRTLEPGPTYIIIDHVSGAGTTFSLALQ